MKRLLSALLMLVCCRMAAQSGVIPVDRITAQQAAYPLERVYLHTDAEDYLQGDRIWIKGYLVEEDSLEPADSSLYLYTELLRQDGSLIRRIKMIRRDGAFYGQMDIPEDLEPAPYILRAYTRYMADMPETAFAKYLSVGRNVGPLPAYPALRPGRLELEERKHGITLRYPTDGMHYLIGICRGKVFWVGGTTKGKKHHLPQDILPEGLLEFMVVNRDNDILDRAEFRMDRGLGRLRVPISFSTETADTLQPIHFSLDLSGLRPGERVDLSSAVICLPAIRRHAPLSILSCLGAGKSGMDLSSALKGRLRRPSRKKESSASIEGKVVTALLERPVKGARVSMISPEANFLDIRISDDDGRFVFDHLDFPAGTHYLVKSTDRKGADRYALSIPEATYPAFSSPEDVYRTALLDTTQVLYADDEAPFDAIELKASVITTKTDGPPPQGFNRNADFSMSLRTIQERGYTCLHELLREVPGIYIFQDTVFIRGASGVSIGVRQPAAIAIDGVIQEDLFDLDDIQMPDVARVDVFKSGQAVIWGRRGRAGVISITTKTGDFETEFLPYIETVHKNVYPLGYQNALSFLAPDPALSRKRTVYWNPKLDDSRGSFRSGRIPGDYLMIVEGITSEGRLIHEEKRFRTEPAVWKKN